MSGLGPVISRTLPAELPELGPLNCRKIAALVGIVLLNRDRGGWRGRRFVWGRRAAVRNTLYMAALTASRHNPVIRALYERLVDRSKRHKATLTACMRKLIVLLNAKAKTCQCWNPELHPTTP